MRLRNPTVYVITLLALSCARTAAAFELTDAAEDANRAGNYGLAVRLYQKCMDNSSCRTSGVVPLAQLYKKIGKSEDSQHLLEDYLSANPFHVGARIELSERLKENGDLKAALKQLQIARRLDPQSLDVKFKLGLCHYAMKRPTDAVHYFSEVLKEQPDHFASRLTRAKIHYETENLSAASADLDQLRAGHPYSAEVAELFGDVKLSQKRFAEAESLFNVTLGLSPQNTGVVEKIGDVHTATGDFAGAKVHYLKGTKMAPQNASMSIKLARTYLALKDSDSAEKELRRTLERNPDNEIATQEIVKIYFDRQRFSQAGMLLQDWYSRHPDFTWSSKDFSKMLLLVEQNKNAMEVIEPHEDVPQTITDMKTFKAAVKSLVGEKKDADEIMRALVEKYGESQKLNQLFAQYRSEIFKVFEPSLSRGASEKMEAEGLKSPTAPTAKTDEKPKQEPAPGATPPAPATPERAPASVSPSTQAPEPVRVHVVARGESLKSISNHYYKTESLWNEIMKANPSIKNPSQVGVGQKLRIPELSQEQIKAKKGEGQ